MSKEDFCLFFLEFFVYVQGRLWDFLTSFKGLHLVVSAFVHIVSRHCMHFWYMILHKYTHVYMYYVLLCIYIHVHATFTINHTNKIPRINQNRLFETLATICQRMLAPLPSAESTWIFFRHGLGILSEELFLRWKRWGVESQKNEKLNVYIVCMYVNVCLSVCLSACLSIYLSIYLSYPILSYPILFYSILFYL